MAMANYCSTRYRIEGKDAKTILNKIASLNADREHITRSVTLWEFAKEFGANIETFNGRGTFEYFEWDEENQSVILNCETAWDWQPDFVDFLKQTFPDSKVYYTAEEPGFEIYVTTDPLCNEIYKIEFCLDFDWDNEYYNRGDEKKVYESICKFCKVTPATGEIKDYIKAAKDLAAYYNDTHGDANYIRIYTFQEQ